MDPARKLCVVLALAATSLCAQQPVVRGTPLANASASQPSSITFTAEVTDKAGHPVAGLPQSDFTVLDDKSPSPLQAFAAHSPGPGSPETAVLAIDMVNMGFGGVSVARNQILDFLRKPNGHLLFPLSLVVIGDNGVKQLASSDDPKTLLAALQAQGGELRELGRSTGYWGATERMSMSLNALTLLARAMTPMPGRKLLIWVGPGWPIFDSPTISYSDHQLRNMFSEAVTLSNEIADARITLYDVDPLGTWDAGSFRTFLWKGFTRPLQRWTRAVPADLALQVLATQSGGQVLSGSNDVAGEIENCAQDGTAWYSITFARRASDKPDTWHSVQIRLARPGLIVRTRPGYYAQPR